MWTQSYKGFIIHGYFNKDECSLAQRPDYKFKSLLAAKQGISRWINKGYPIPKYVL